MLIIKIPQLLNYLLKVSYIRIKKKKQNFQSKINFSSFFIIIIIIIEQPIIFRRPLRSQIVEESSPTVSNNAIFECELNKPLKQMLWFKSNVQHIVPSDKYQIESFANGHIHRLTIRNVNLRDEGEYTASTGLNTSQAKLTVEPLMPVFIVPLMDARANTTETIKLSCETSNPCQVVWMHRGKKIIENSYKYTIGF